MANSDYRPTGLAIFAANFERNMAAPLDATMLVKGYENITQADAFTAQDGGNYSYAGMIVGVYGSAIADNDGVYQLKQLPTTEAANWKKLATTDDITGLEGEYYTKSQVDQLLSTINSAISSLNENALTKENNLSDVNDVATARTNLDVYSKSEVDAIGTNTLTAANAYTDSKFSTSLQYQVVSALPASGEANVIYLVPADEPGEQNTHDEYMWVDGTWEKIGTTEVDLSGYVQTNSDATLNSLSVTTNITAAKVTSPIIGIGSIAISGVDVSALTENTSAVPTSKAVYDAISVKADSSVGSELSTRVDTISGDLDSLESTVTSLGSDKQDVAISLEGITAQTVEGALLEIVGKADVNAEAIDGINTALSQKQNASDDTLETTNKTIVGAINELQTEVNEAAKADDVAATYQTKTIATTIAGQTTVEGALSAINTNVTTLSGEIDTLNGSLTAYQTKTDETLTTTSKQVVGAINELKTSIDSAVSDATELEGRVGTLETTVAGHTSSISTINNTLSGKADKATTLSGYGITDAYTKTEADGRFVVQTRTVNGKALSADIVLTGEDVNVSSTEAVTIASKFDTITSSLSTALQKANNLSDVENVTTARTNLDVYSKSEVDSKFSTSLKYTVVSSLPASGDEGTVYLVPQEGEGSENNIKDEYMWIDGAWELIGSTAVDLTPYQTKNDEGLATTDKTVVGAINEVKTTADSALSTANANTTALSGKVNTDASNIATEQVSSWKAKLGFITSDEIPEQAQPDWTAASGLAQILNKPDVETSSGRVVVANTSKQASIAGKNIDVLTFEGSSTTLTIPVPAGVVGAVKMKIIVGGSDLIVYTIDVANTVAYKEVLTQNTTNVTVTAVDSTNITATKTAGTGNVVVELEYTSLATNS